MGAAYRDEARRIAVFADVRWAAADGSFVFAAL
jgi:hypothetical protein